jgi:hypothetical protein
MTHVNMEIIVLGGGGGTIISTCTSSTSSGGGIGLHDGTAEESLKGSVWKRMKEGDER